MEWQNLQQKKNNSSHHASTVASTEGQNKPSNKKAIITNTQENKRGME